jgi:hypothetical protein
MQPDHLTLESLAITKLGDWCAELNFGFLSHGWYCEIKPPDHQPLSVEWLAVSGVPAIKILRPLSLYPHDRAPFPAEVMHFILRRNADTSGIHWCLSRHEGLCVVAVRSLQSLTADKFRRLVVSMSEEHKQLAALAEKEWPEPDEQFAEEIGAEGEPP